MNRKFNFLIARRPEVMGRPEGTNPMAQKTQYLMTISERPGFPNTHVLQKAYAPGAYTISLTDAEKVSVEKKAGVKLQLAADASAGAGAMVVLSEADATLIAGYRKLCEDVMKVGAPNLSPEDFVSLARRAALHELDRKSFEEENKPTVVSGSGPETKLVEAPVAPASAPPVTEAKPAETKPVEASSAAPTAPAVPATPAKKAPKAEGEKAK